MSEMEPVQPMYFASLEIENIKCFGKKQVLDLRDRDGAVSPWTLILGDNGIGKTTLLKCLAWMLPVEETDRVAKKEANIPEAVVALKPFMDGFENNSEYEELIRVGKNVKSKVSASFTVGVELGTLPTDKNYVRHGIEIGNDEGGKFDHISLEFGQLPSFNSPNLFAYSASRHMASKNFEKPEMHEPTSNLFSASGDLYDAEQLLAILDNAAIRQNRSGKASDLLEKVKNILVDLLPYVNDPDDIIINSPLKEDGSTNDILVEVQTPDGKVPLFNLSLGYITMLAWTVDLALRMLWHYPESEDPLQQPAVVLVDEIDLHLHPKWQRMIRQHLTDHFPRTQFICTAHSPFMAQSSELENLCVIHRLDDDEVTVENEPSVVRGWRIGQIITSDLFGVTSERSPEVEAIIDKRRALLAKRNLTDPEKTELARLDDEISQLPVAESGADQALLDQIRRTAEQLRMEGKLP
jgi:hypothetical protein